MAVSNNCDHLVSFTGIDTIQNYTSYATFSKWATITLHEHSTPAITFNEIGTQIFIALILFDTRNESNPKFEIQKFEILIEPLTLTSDTTTEISKSRPFPGNNSSKY